MTIGDQHQLLRFRGMGDISSDFSQLSTDVMAGNFSTAFSDTISGLPAWVWLSGGVFLYMFFFAGGEEHSRVGRARRAAKKGYRAAASEY